MANKEQLIEIFEDTKRWYEEESKLAEAVRQSVMQTKVYMEEDAPALWEGLKNMERKAIGAATVDAADTADTPGTKEQRLTITVSKNKTFEAALKLRQQFPNSKIAVHNFASATNPGGGVTRGSRAQEECLCRCSTLYPALNTKALWGQFYQYHRNRHDVRYTDTCIYTPDVLIIKTDTEMPERMPENEWCGVDVITCAAPNLRAIPNNAMNPGTGAPVKVSERELLELHKKRARHMLATAAVNGAEILVLGAFGCGAFQNKPEVVARAYRETIDEFAPYFKWIEFAVYCSPRDSKNYEVFRRVLGKMGKE